MKIIEITEEYYLDDIMELQSIVIDSLPDKSLYCSSSHEQILDQIRGKGLCIGTISDNKLVAFSTVLFPDPEKNLGLDIELDEDKLDLVCHKELTIVHPDYRGNGLQDKMFKVLEKKVKEETKYRIIMNTIAPDNIYSLRNSEKNGMKQIAIANKYGTKRIISYKEL